MRYKHLVIDFHFKHKWDKDILNRHAFDRSELGIEWQRYKSVGYGKNPFSFIFVVNLIWIRFWFNIKWKVKVFHID